MGRRRFVKWAAASLVVGCSFAACVAEMPTSEEMGRSASAVTAPAGIPCAARAEAVIANTGEVFSNSGSLVDSYQSSAGAYGGKNVGTSGNVQAAEAIVNNGGVIHGTETPNSAADLAIVAVPTGATNLPLGAKTPGNLNITTAAESLTLEPGSYVVDNLSVQSSGAITISPPGQVLIWVTGNLNLGGTENLNGVPDDFEVLVTSSGSVNVNGTGELYGFVYAPTSMVSVDSTVFGGVVGSTVNLNGPAALHFDQSSECPVADAGADASADARVDATLDASSDAARDVSADVADAGADHDAATDASTDVRGDSAVDADGGSGSGGHDASVDASPDAASTEAGGDSSSSGGGGGQDAVAADVAADVAVDTGGGGGPTCTPASCDTNNPCVVDTCNTNGTCSHVPVTNGSSCGTGNLCFGGGACESGACVGTSPVTCTPSDQCHVAGTCNPTTGTCSNPAAPDGTTCNDGNLCDLNDTCQSAVCTAGGSVVCTASDACHGVGSCSPTTGVCSNPLNGSCNDAGTPVAEGGTGALTLGGTVASNLASTAASLFTTADGGTGAINPTQVAVIRGRVFMLPSGNPFVGVTISVLGHPEYGTVMSGTNGSFKLAVNGGGQATVVYTPPTGVPTYLPVERHTPTQWQQYAVLPDVYMTPEDPNANPITMSNATWQAAQGSTITDPADLNGVDGGPPVSPTLPHTARVFFPAGTSANLTYGPCSGTSESTCSAGTSGTCEQGSCVSGVCTGTAPASLTVRATEYTVGATGLAAMPAELPPSTAYTYAVELGADEANAAGANGISFNQPVSFYVEDFIGFGPAQAGTANPPVPVGYYDKIAGQWVPSPNGNVLQITGFSGTCPGAGCTAIVNQPVNSDAGASVTLSSDELTFLGQTYGASATPLYLWRITTQHFTALDPNWPYLPPSGATGPAGPPPSPNPPAPDPDPECTGGSIIECQNQILAQQLPVSGTPYFLRYQSERAPGRPLGIQIPLTGNPLPVIAPPSAFLRIDVAIAIAGQVYNLSYPAASLTPNQTVQWTWNQTDADGNTVEGIQEATVTTSYVYQGQYAPNGNIEGNANGFATFPPLGAFNMQENRVLNQFAFSTITSLHVGGVQDAAPLGLGGWTLSAQHVYDPGSLTFWGGDGKRRTVASSPMVTQALPGSTGLGRSTLGPGFGVAPDGTVYASNTSDTFATVSKVDTSGNVTVVAGADSNSNNFVIGPFPSCTPSGSAFFEEIETLACHPTQRNHLCSRMAST